ncbi:MAG: hypothetical protein OJF55_002131 [Rhodanobacteraceae bacterium]|jgi:hypothetical protein|nr:MAG: hypothetical protein OJF55_002131 [Rhodanobacteraceae bacterium]
MRTTTCRRPAALAAACAFALALAACHHAPPPPSNATPEKAVATSLQLTASGDFDGLMRNRLPPADYATWRAEWDKQHAHPMPASVDQQKQFADIMRMLTEPGAEAKLAKRLQPELADLRGKSQTMPIFGSILEAAIKQMIAESPQLGPAQQTLANQGLGALAEWAKTTDFSDTKKAGKAIALVCATARELHVQTLDQWRALDYATTMKDYGIIWNGLEKLLDLYGLDIAGSLTDAKVGATANDGSHVTVKLDLKLAGKPLSGAWPMLKQDGHWYDAALLEAWQKAHPATAASTAAPAGTAPAPATSAPPPSAAIPAPHASATPAASHS